MAQDLGIDIGTSNTTVFMKGKGIVLSEPSVVAVNQNTGRPVAVGTAAERMIGRTPASIKAIRPVRNGTIADFEAAEFMMNYFLTKVSGLGVRLGSVRMLLTVPTVISEVEQLAVLEAVKSACGKTARVKARLIEVPLASAIGADLPLSVGSAEGSMIIDVGGGTTEICAFSMGCILKGDSVKVGGEDFSTQLVNYVKSEHNLIIGETSAEEAKKKAGSVFPTDEPRFADISGRDIITGMPGNVRLNSNELVAPLKDPAIKIIA